MDRQISTYRCYTVYKLFIKMTHWSFWAFGGWLILSFMGLILGSHIGEAFTVAIWNLFSLYWLLLLLLLNCFSCVRLCAPPQTAAHQAPRPWDSAGKNTGVGYHFLRQCMKVKSESEVAQSCLTLRDPMDCSPPGSSVHGIFQARVLMADAKKATPNSQVCFKPLLQLSTDIPLSKARHTCDLQSKVGEVPHLQWSHGKVVRQGKPWQSSC